MSRYVWLLLAWGVLAGQTEDPAYGPLQKAYQAVRAGQHRLALAFFSEAAELAGERPLIHRELGYAHLRLQQWKLAAKSFQRALDLKPGDYRTALDLAYAFQRTGGAEEARLLLEQVAQSGTDELAPKARQALEMMPGPSAPAASLDEAETVLSAAYEALGRKDYEAGIDRLQEAARLSPRRAAVRKELGYTYLRMGETGWAREMFEQAVLLDPADERADLELAYLFHETNETKRALTLFRRLAESSDPGIRLAARQAFEGIDRSLAEEIHRWVQAVAADPANWSAQKELAGLYDKRGDAGKAAAHYLAAWFADPPYPEEILLKLAAALEDSGQTESARGAWLLASRSKDTRTAETARPHLPDRYPYASEFRAALELAPQNTELRRELAFLLLEVGLLSEAQTEFERILRDDPNDLLAAAQLAFLYLERNNEAAAVELLEKARSSRDGPLSEKVEQTLRRVRESQARPHRELGTKSLRLGYLKDARRELLAAYQVNPADYTVALQLGVVYNLLQRDREAIKWFRTAANSPDREVAQQATQSYRNLAPPFRRFSTTVWTYPFFSSRFKDLFNYAQVKTEVRMGRLPVTPYLSLRFVGDVRTRTGGANPQFLSEGAFIAGAGLRAQPYRGVTLWGEAGQALSYLQQRPDGVPKAAPDYRGGVSLFRSWGHTLADPGAGPSAELSVDGVYISRFDNNVIGYWQLRPGYRLRDRGSRKMMLFWNLNLTVDKNRAYWANFFEFGPGVRFRIPGVSPPLDLSIHALRGVHLVNEFNPRRPNYHDLRVALWYSFAR